MLDPNQKAYILQKVKEIGDVEKVKQFYFKDDTVSQYANILAGKLLKKGDEHGRKRLNKKGSSS